MKMLMPLTLCLYKYNKFNMNMMILIMISLLSTTFLLNPNPTLCMNFMFNMDFLSSLMISLSLVSMILITMSINHMKSQNLLTLILLILIMTFSVSKSFQFYILFEMVLIPTLILITKMGKQPERLQAGVYLILYTVMASLPFLVGLLFMKSHTDMMFTMLICKNFPLPMIFMLAFLAKMPMFLLHLWLPKAHVEAPLEGSMILAAVLLKLGGYGLIRFAPLLYMNIKNIPMWIISISLLGAMITSMSCMRQKDLKALIAYSSVAHMGLVLSSIMTMNSMATNGAIIMMIAHGVSSAALFFLVNLIYLKFHTRNIILFSGVFTSYPNLTFWWFMFTAANISAPPSINLISEIMMLMGLINWDMWLMIILSAISIMTTAFSIFMFIMISHNKTMLKFSENTQAKYFLSLFSHLAIIIIMILKLEFMILT